MITGVVRLKDVLSHPIIMIHEYGLASYLTIILKGLSSHQYQFTSLVCSSDAPRDQGLHPDNKKAA